MQNNGVERVFTDRRFIKEINKSKKNWMDISEEEALEKDIEFVIENNGADISVNKIFFVG